jgi:anaerobic ribonucleoside-triphosphate reductase activating protein
MQLRVAQTVRDTEAEGPGRRFAVWVQGCTLGCPGCCNPEMLAPGRGGRLVDVATLAAEIAATPHIEGVTLLGGEPFQQPEACAALAEAVRAAGRSVMVFTGYTLEELRARIVAGEPGVAALLDATDLLVDGRYLRDEPEPTVGGRRYIGSRNQRMHFLSSRYSADDPRLRAANTVELRLERGALTVNGWPAAAGALVDAATLRARRS